MTVALCAAINQHYTKYATALRIQSARKEIVEELDSMVAEVLISVCSLFFLTSFSISYPTLTSHCYCLVAHCLLFVCVGNARVHGAKEGAAEGDHFLP